MPRAFEIAGACAQLGVTSRWHAIHRKRERASTRCVETLLPQGRPYDEDRFGD
jgi:hypothetical protein